MTVIAKTVSHLLLYKLPEVLVMVSSFSNGFNREMNVLGLLSSRKKADRLASWLRCVKW